MSISIDNGAKRAETVGVILAQVRDDLRRLKKELLSSGQTDASSLQALESAISRTEGSIEEQSRKAVHILHDHVATLPAAVDGMEPRAIIKHQRSSRHPKSYTAPPLLSISSPGQEAQLSYMGKLLSQPTHPTTRQLLCDTYGLPTAHAHQHVRPTVRQSGHRVGGATVPHLTVLPVSNRRNALLTPPPITGKDAQKGLLSLLERGLIPKAADIVLQPPPVQPKLCSLQNFSRQKLKSYPVDAVEGGSTLAGVKFDHNPSPKKPLPPIKPHPPSPDQQVLSVKVLGVPSLSSKEELSQQKEKLAARDPVSCKGSRIYKIPVQGGLVLKNSQEYIAFEILYQDNWHNIGRLLQLIETMAQEYAIPVIFIHGHKLSELAKDCELEPLPKYKDLFPCVMNLREVEHLLNMPGRRYKGINGVDAAATKIQTHYRRYHQRSKYLEHRRMRWASGVIAMAWIMYVRSCTIRDMLKERRAGHVANYRRRLQELGDNWATIKQGKRIVIHLPSKGYLPHIRCNMTQFPISQNLQISRICDVMDTNVEVIYILPVELEQEVFDYYRQLVDIGNDKEKKYAWSNIHFITPEHLSSFGHHRLPLASLLKYSPKALKHIKLLMRNIPAYIMPHLPCRDDLEVADILDVPLFGTEPELICLYSTHNGRCQLFSGAKMPIPPSAGDIYSLDQLIERLALLMVNNVLVQRWIFKIDHHIRARGIAYCDVAKHSKSYKWMVKESERYGSKWSKRWAQEGAIRVLTRELPSILAQHSITADKSVFPTWNHYLQAFFNSGGSVEAHPPSDSVTSVTVDILIEPDLSYSILSTWDHIHSDTYQVWGGSMPQTSIEPGDINAMTKAVAGAAISRGIVGHISIDMVTFIHPQQLAQKVWLVDLDFGPSDYVALYSLMSTVTGLHISSDTCRLSGPLGERFAVVSTRLQHSNLSMIQYNVFFKMCKAHLIGYDKKNCTGSIFTLVESHRISKLHLGMISVQPSLKEALEKSSHALSAIHQEISTSNQQGSSNFPAVVKEMDNIISLIDDNTKTSA